MDSEKAIITNHKVTSKIHSLENEIGLSTYDIALIAINKIIKNNQLSLNDDSSITYLI